MALKDPQSAGKRSAGRDRIPWSYQAGNSPLHRLPGAVKLVLLIGLSASPFLGPPFMAAAALLICSGAFCAGIRPWELLKGFRPLFIMLLFVIVIRGFDLSFVPLDGTEDAASGSLLFVPLWESPRINLYLAAGALQGAVFFAGGILLSFAACSLLFSVSTMMELRRSLERIELFVRRPFSGGRKKHGTASLALALMLGFLPRFFERWEAAKTALRARGSRLRGLAGLKLLTVIIPLVSEGMIETAAETALALEARGLEL